MWGKENKNGVIIFENGSVMQFLIMTKTIDGLTTLFTKVPRTMLMQLRKSKATGMTIIIYKIIQGEKQC